MNKRKKSIFLLLLYVTILFNIKNIQKKPKINIEYSKKYEDTINPYAYYGNRSIYIGSEEDITKIKDRNDDNIYIADNRFQDNSSMSIIDSYKIVDINDINNILNVLIKYEQDYSSDWDRTFYSMKLEWIAHNICYYLNYEKDRTGNVDLDNNDEEKYNNILCVLFRLKDIIDLERENEEKTIRTLKKNN